VENKIKLSIVIPVYNDERYIVRNIERLRHDNTLADYDVELIIIDDGSTDNTDVLIKQLVKEMHIKFMSYSPNAGKGNAFVKGVERATGEYVLLIDSDLQISPAELPVFFNVMSTYNADAVIGNKRHTYSKIHYTFRRRIISNTYNTMCRKLFGIQLRDTQCGLKLFKRTVLNKVIDKLMVKRYAFDIELLVALRENNYRIADAPVFMDKQYNTGSISVKNIISVFMDTINIWIRKKKGYYL